MMSTFRLAGQLAEFNGVPVEGTLSAVPSVLPLTPIDDDGDLVVMPVLGFIDRGKYDLEMPSSDGYVEDFSLQVMVKLNSGSILTGAVEPMVEGSVMKLDDVISLTIA